MAGRSARDEYPERQDFVGQQMSRSMGTRAMASTLAMGLFFGLTYLLRTLSSGSAPKAGAVQQLEAEAGMHITIDRQTLTKECPECKSRFVVFRGSAYDSGRRIALYLIGLHGHSPQGRLAHVAVGVIDESGAERLPVAMAVRVSETSEQFECQFVPWSESPWIGETYLGEMLDPEAARGNPHRDVVFAIIDRLLEDLPEVRSYFE
jgi:hypothetical protein